MISTKSMRNFATLAATATAVLFLTAVSGNAASSSSQIACQKALDIGTKSALRAFMRAYPKSDTACNALASTASAEVTVSVKSDSSDPSDSRVNSSDVLSSFNTGSVPVVTTGGGSTGSGGQGGGSQGNGGGQSGDLLSDLKGEIAKIAKGQ
jgi:uncharacterized membrane protein YgcG